MMHAPGFECNTLSSHISISLLLPDLWAHGAENNHASGCACQLGPALECNCRLGSSCAVCQDSTIGPLANLSSLTMAAAVFANSTKFVQGLIKLGEEVVE